MKCWVRFIQPRFSLVHTVWESSDYTIEHAAAYKLFKAPAISKHNQFGYVQLLKKKSTASLLPRTGIIYKSLSLLLG
uniref:Uncharacterized protein n=1 Tax=Rhizophora mucronata TaxID=61149 RepID=A0A2P2N6N8_RHIMU